MPDFNTNITVEIKSDASGMFNAYIAAENCSGENYQHISADEIGEHVAGLIECLADNY